MAQPGVTHDEATAPVLTEDGGLLGGQGQDDCGVVDDVDHLLKYFVPMHHVVGQYPQPLNASHGDCGGHQQDERVVVVEEADDRLGVASFDRPLPTSGASQHLFTLVHGGQDATRMVCFTAY